MAWGGRLGREGVLASELLRQAERPGKRAPSCPLTPAAVASRNVYVSRCDGLA
jgi:hypothetical protein